MKVEAALKVNNPNDLMAFLEILKHKFPDYISTDVHICFSKDVDSFNYLHVEIESKDWSMSTEGVLGSWFILEDEGSSWSLQNSIDCPYCGKEEIECQIM